MLLEVLKERAISWVVSYTFLPIFPLLLGETLFKVSLLICLLFSVLIPKLGKVFEFAVLSKVLLGGCVGDTLGVVYKTTLVAICPC